MTLLNLKNSTKDVDFLVPDEGEYVYLINTLEQLGYQHETTFGWKRLDELFIFDLYLGTKIYTTELLESPLDEGNHIWIEQFQRIELGVLNYYDLIISKLFRAADVDVEDCLMLMKVKHEEIDIQKLEHRFKKTASFDISEEKVLKNWEYFRKLLKEKMLL